MRGISGRIAGIFALLAGANAAAWAWALVAFHEHPVLLGTAMLAYSLGLRHAIDADHLAAIDNVTRKLMQEKKRPIGVGLYFALGHSTVVVLASAAIAAGAGALATRFENFKDLGGMVGTLVSAVFLLAIGIANIFVLVGVYRTFKRVKSGGHYAEDELDRLLVNRGFLGRLFRPLFHLVRASWQMYPLGFLFGLGFDTATEIGVLGISGSQAAQGLPVSCLLIFPALFTAGMALVDTADSVLMLSAYEWGFAKPIRKLYYNLTITAASVLVALLIGTVEALGLISEKLALQGEFWDFVARLNGAFGTLGYFMVALFALVWAVSVAVYRFKSYDRLELSAKQL